MARFARLSLLLLAAAGFPLVTLAAPPAKPVSWDVVKVANRDWLTVDNIARFYGLPVGVAPIDKVILLNNGRQSLQVRLESREIILNGVRNWLSFPVIEHEGQYLVSRVDLAKTIEPQMRPHMIQNMGKVTTVIVDPGHGGFDKGARCTYGHEKNFALDVARQLKPMLEKKGFKVILTRDKDVFVPLHIRARIANAVPNSVFVSIHFNATGADPNANGFEIFSLTPRGAPSTDDSGVEARFMNVSNGTGVDACSLGLSTSVYHAMLGHMPGYDRGIKRARFAVLRHTKVPAILVEGGFVSHREESKKIKDREWRSKLAQAICTGLENYRDLAHNKRKPMLLADYRRAQTGENMLAQNLIIPPAGSSASPAEFLTASHMGDGEEVDEPDVTTAEEAESLEDVPAEVREAATENTEPGPQSSPSVPPADQPPTPTPPAIASPTPRPIPATVTQPQPTPTPRILHFSPPPKFLQ